MPPIQFMLHYSADFENMPIFFAIQRWWRQKTEAFTTQKTRAALLLRMLKNKAKHNSVARIVTNEKKVWILIRKKSAISNVCRPRNLALFLLLIFAA
jgi:hypothetical protein